VDECDVFVTRYRSGKAYFKVYFLFDSGVKETSDSGCNIGSAFVSSDFDRQLILDVSRRCVRHIE
jgi:hypothetical protein